jgi:hypothetical protein
MSVTVASMCSDSGIRLWNELTTNLPHRERNFTVPFPSILVPFINEEQLIILLSSQPRKTKGSHIANREHGASHKGGFWVRVGGLGSHMESSQKKKLTLLFKGGFTCN